jgi:lysyl-tRNA synthetase class 2
MDKIDQESYKQMRLDELSNFNYPYKYNYDQSTNKYEKISISKYINMYHDKLENGFHDDMGEYYECIGRVIFIRRASKKLLFIDVVEEGNKIQLMANAKLYSDSVDNFKSTMSKIRIGDCIGFSGIPARTKMGELSLIPHHVMLLSPCLYMIPQRTIKIDDEEKPGLSNPEIRFRQRYLDLIVNSNINLFTKRSNIIKNIRRFLEDELEIIEVETPILSTSVGGANAKPYETESFDYKCPMFMRVAPELYLKMLIIGGFRGVYELGKQFRNESNDLTHNSEFTSLEFYIQNHDYHDLMDICENLFSYLFENLEMNYEIQYSGKTINMKPPFKRIDMIPELEKKTSTIFPKDLSTLESNQFLNELCKKHNVECSSPRTNARLLDKLVGHFIEPDCIDPTFIINHPLVMSPLAKKHRDNEFLTERFELFVNGTELANAYTELNIPSDQIERFDEQSKFKYSGDDEAMAKDYNFVKALEYGLPPTGGFGLGIDRLVMLLTNNTSIREVILFPTMKPIIKK